MRYAINTLYPAIQGEGSLAGTPMVLVRLQGCAVGCPWCDTKETWKLLERFKVDSLEDAQSHPSKWTMMHSDDIADAARAAAPRAGWIMLTGGEPAEHDLTELCEAFTSRGFRVQLETSGTMTLDRFEGHIAHIVVSPKIDMPGGRDVLPEAVALADEIKFVIENDASIDRLRFLLRSNFPSSATTPPVFVQPVSLSPTATKLCIDAAFRYGWRVSVQLHKLLELP
jgi:7-carboxy-7-deazaguanine synthase